ncbi:MAG: molybdopterin-dependent oxidoreductase [Phycicoccus sp.]
MATHVNGQTHTLDPERHDTLVDALRDGAGLTGTKLVCGAGVCGACTVHLDGEPVVSCLVPTSHAEGAEVTTVEGVGSGSVDGLHPVQRALAHEDGLQCGFCTPGFVMDAVAFVDTWRARDAVPEMAEVAAALSGHLCRCGAYPGIVRAVQRACAGDFDRPGEQPPQRVEAHAKVTGAARYTVDVRLEGQLTGMILRSPHPHARVVSIDLEPARAVTGVRAAVSMLAPEDVVRYVGQEVAAVAAVDREAAEHGIRAVTVEYEVLPAVVGAEAARAGGAPRVYPGLRKPAPSAAEGPLFPTPWKGNVRGPTTGFSSRRGRARRTLERARAAGDPRLVEGVFTTSPQVHTPLEPHACVAHWVGGSLEVHVSTQAVAHLRHALAERFDLDDDRVVVVAEHVGGAFGNKLALTGETVAAVELARAAAAPVGVVLDRAEELTVGGHRPAARLDVALLAGADDELAAVRFHADGDGGVSIGSAIAGLARVMYPAAAKDLVDNDVVSNLPPGTPFRGPGGPLTCWALEQAVDDVAGRLGTDPLELRRCWDPDPLRHALYDWASALPAWQQRDTVRGSGPVRRGVGVAAANWFYWYDAASEVEVATSGEQVVVSTAVQDMGTGIRTVLARTVADELGIDAARVVVRLGDSRLRPGPVSGGSRTTATLVPAAVAAARQLRDDLSGGWRDHRVVRQRGSDPAAAPGVSGPFGGAGAVGWVFDQALRRLGGLTTGHGWTGAVVVSEVEVDTRTGHVRVIRVHEGLAVGRPQARRLAESQVHGAVVQGVGFALYEERQHDAATGRVLSAGLEDYRIPGIADAPEVAVHFHEAGFEHVEGGGVGLGEVATLAVAASVGNAVHHATGWRPRDLPMRPDRVLAGLAGTGRAGVDGPSDADGAAGPPGPRTAESSSAAVRGAR